MKKIMRIGLAILVVLLLAYKSVYFRKLSEVKAASSVFDAKAYARNYFDHKLLPSLANAVEVNDLLAQLGQNREKAFQEFSHALGIGNIGYFLIKGKGLVTAVNENEVWLSLATDSTQMKLRIATEFVFGNAIRDASGTIDINEFSNTIDFNNVSAEVNKIVRDEILPGFKSNVVAGDTVSFAGAVELNRRHLDTENMEVMPVQLSIQKQPR